MIFPELVQKVARIKCDEQRSVGEDYCEVVVQAGDLAQLHALLEPYFGPPLKLQEASSAEARKHAEPYGGVRNGQIMYFRELPSGPEFALLWPWGSGTSVTVKLIHHR